MRTKLLTATCALLALAALCRAGEPFAAGPNGRKPTARKGPPAVQDEQLQLGGLELDLARRTAAIDGKELSLTPKEFDLLTTFARFPNVVLDREQILDFVWGTSFYALRTVDVHVARLREKLRGASLRIETVWGTGYRLAVVEE